jgi:hypothetical protein
MESNSDLKSVMFGLETYLEAFGTEDQRILVRELTAVIGSQDPNSAVIDAVVRILGHQQDNKHTFFRSVNGLRKRLDDPLPLYDALSRSQIKSKIWLIEELLAVKLYWPNVVIMAGWYGQLVPLFEQMLTFDRARIVELDPDACRHSDQVVNVDKIKDFRVKSVVADINQLALHKNGYEWLVDTFKDSSYTEKFLPDLIVNTSAEHMTEEWYSQIRFKQLDSNPVVAIQSNNLFDIPEHVNCVHSVSHMKKKYPMREILFEGELRLKGYKRFMLIGRP